jgi:hypothetical protein
LKGQKFVLLLAPTTMKRNKQIWRYIVDLFVKSKKHFRSYYGEFFSSHSVLPYDSFLIPPDPDAVPLQDSIDTGRADILGFQKWQHQAFPLFRFILHCPRRRRLFLHWPLVSFSSFLFLSWLMETLQLNESSFELIY